MNIRPLVIRFAANFAVAFVVNAIVIYLWNLIRHGEGAFSWETSFVLAIVLGIVFVFPRVQKGRVGEEGR